MRKVLVVANFYNVYKCIISESDSIMLVYPSALFTYSVLYLLQSVALDLVEMLFKDQYFSRSDFWRLRNGIIGTCVYLNKKIEHAEMR